ncbi:CRIB domain-containing protein RIC4 isoform X1 [Herrania umbratica]|uniref:CRIB domain-containing protein RIC4 isoform X1 n=1 Tax=Herrania umbratica TaxID=108875 RepID=A0A6J1A4S3_9ROSI|nr:CRIB domain-containing protein RIC4 isoform X1 [Herrania umbratica]
MRDRMERFVILPFSVGCVSESSVAVAVQQPRRSKPADTNPTAAIVLLVEAQREEDEESLSNESMKYSLKFLPLPKPDISTGFHRLCKSFKTFSQIFAYKEDSEKEMEIGFPTDVKHVTHIGLDGSASSSPSMGSWENLLSPHELFTFPSVPSGQCELPMETQAAAASPLVQAST